MLNLLWSLVAAPFVGLALALGELQWIRWLVSVLIGLVWLVVYAPWAIPVIVFLLGLVVVVFGRDIEYINRRRREDRDREARRSRLILTR